MFAEVIVDLVSSEIDRIFEYRCDNLGVRCGSRVRVPFGNKIIDGIVIGLKDKSDFDESRIKPIHSVFDEESVLTEETLALADYVRKRYFVSRAQALRLFLPVEMRKGKVKEKFTRVLKAADGIDLKECVDKLNKSAQKQKAFLEYLIENGSIDSVSAAAKFGASAVKGAENKGFIKIEQVKNYRKPYEGMSAELSRVTLTPAQKSAADGVRATDKRVTLLFGVTGSGKTEVYLDIISDVISRGKTAIMLVPEISLTPQTFKRIRSRFGDNAAILHSGLSAGEKFDEWWRLRSGEAKIAIGARSAVFAPLKDIGVIIIDEEHDASYLSESAPRYSTADIAKVRAEYWDAKVVLGSATPSLESYMLAKKGEYALQKLPDRINGKPLPKVSIVDMRNEIRRGNNTLFSSALKEELESCLKSGNQAMLFLNQRGYSKTVICTECGHVETCGNCDVSLTYHKEDDALLCHYCGAKYKMVKACTECGSPYIRYGGTGTQKVVEELKKLYPAARILRMDRDATQTKEGHFKILESFAKKEADILVGTQMIAKGHDFPSVTLVGILDADASLHFSDFRSNERTFQLVTQVAGRSGRAGETGKVVLQTYTPDNPLLTQAVRYDYEGFFEREISIRKATAFPPFTDIVRVVFSAEKEDDAVQAVKAAYGELSVFYAANKSAFSFFGCMKAPIKRLQSKYRYQILMRIEKDSREILNRVFTTVDKYNGRRVWVSMELNPANLS